MLGRKLARNRKFNYEPEYYDPDKDEHNKRKINFKGKLRKRAAKQKSLLSFFILLFILLYLIYFLSKLNR